MSSIREISRLARRVPVLKDVLESTDPRRRAERLARTGVVDAALYAAQLGVPSISVEDAAAHYASVGFRWGYTLNVLTDPYVIRRAMIRTDRPALYDYFNSRAWHANTTGVWSVKRYADEYPESLEHPAGPVGHLWERVRRDASTEVVIEPGGARPLPWSEIYPVLFDATVEWAALQRDRRNRYPRAELEHAESLEFDGPATGARASIIMPVWNRGGAMRAAIESVLAQSWENWELLIVDDGSWDDTVAVAELLSARDPRIRLLRQDHLGVCAARNAGIAEATGEFIAFLDSDNTWKPHFLRDMVTTMTRDSLTSAYATIALDDGRTVRYRYGSPAPQSLILGNSIDLNTLVARKDAIVEVGGFDPELRRAVDYDLILKLAAHSPITHVPTLGAHYDNADDAADRISTTEAIGWNTSVRLRHSRVEASDVVGAATVVTLIQPHDPILHSKLAALAEAPEGTDVRFVGVGVRPDQWRQITAAAHRRDRVSAALHQDGEPFAYVVDLELSRSRSAVFAVIDPRSAFSRDTLVDLIEEVGTHGSDAVIPLTLGLDGTVESVGSMLVGAHGAPVAILGGHPAEDARRLGDRVAVSALSGRTFAIGREVLESIGGIDPLLYNEHELAGLSAGLSGHGLVARTDIVLTQVSPAREFTVTDPAGTMNALRSKNLPVTSSDGDEAYARAGLRVAHWRRELPPPLEPHEIGSGVTPPMPLVPVVVRDRRDVEIDGRTVPRLRWAIKTASPAGPKGETWGDTHFGRSLAAALETLGQETVVDAREAQRRETDYLDDVVIHLRGLDVYAPSPGALSYLWVISHPDMVTRQEAQVFDRVFAASLSWSAQQSRRWGFPVEALLQCTDPDRFHPGDSPTAVKSSRPLFVGNSRGIPRPTVMESIRAGLPLELYGGDWERFVPEDAITGERVDNAELGQLYSSAAVVLNDHWADMQREGFISNRLFDVVAAGGRAFSDDVPGIDRIFDGAVQTYDTVSEIVPFLESDLDERFPDADALAEISRRIREEHSFAARARILLDHAIADLAAQGRR